MTKNIIAALAACTLVSINAQATTPTPPAGSVGPTTDDTAEWANSGPPVSTGSATCTNASNAACDNFALTVVPPASGNYVVTVALQPLGGDDYDLEVYAPDGTTVLGSSGNAPGAVEVVSISNPPAGVYTVAASPFAAALGYNAIASMALLDPPPPGGSEDIEFYVYVDPAQNQGGEPSGGINWNAEPADGELGGDNGGSIMFVSSLSTLRVEHNDCTAPATYIADGEWKDISVPQHVTSLDPIGLVDPVTGRYFSDQLAVKSSLLGLSDDDGETWLPSQGAPINPGVDHQTLGTGPFTEPLFSALAGNSVDPHANAGHGVWYASQDIALAQAGFSTDGGTTFGPANPMWTLGDCSGLHGHLKVTPRNPTTIGNGKAATLYVPNKSCNGQQGVVISEDSGLTWAVSRVQNTTAGEWDPSIGVANDGTVYIGMDQGGAPMAAVSIDGGDTWSDPIDVSGGLIKTTSFSTMVAGDGDRAAFGFLGTTTPGALGTDANNTFPAVWDLYVAMTFDRGVIWNITNVTDGDPVQRGVICDQGTTCPSNRNLLDFNDIQMDKRGRPIVYFADGCTGNCVNNDSQRTQARLATIARLKSPKGLLAAFDADRTGVPDWPLAEAGPQGANDVLISWQEPGDGGSAIDFYEVRKDGVLLDTVPATFFSYTDVGAQSDPAGTYYEVLAHNAIGYSRGPGGTPSPLKAACDNRVFVGDPPDPDPFTECDFEGLKILDDNAADILQPGNPAAGTPGSAAYDMNRLGISQNEDIYGAGNIAFIIDVQSTDVLPPNSYWPLQFELPGDPVPGGCFSPPTGTAGTCDAFVRMDTIGTPTDPNFTFGMGNSVDPLTAPGAPAAAQSSIQDGKITIVVPMSSLGLSAGDMLAQFMIRARLNVGIVTITPDNMPDSLAGEGAYTVVDFPTFCAVNQPPILVDDVATIDSCQPAVIDVLNDPATGDSDPEGDTLTITGVTGEMNGISLIIEDVGGQKVQYTSNTNFVGIETLTYTVEDGNGNTASADITVTVNMTPDSDEDGVMNSCDNCTLTMNVEQCDDDNDGYGNHCDGDFNNSNFVNFVDLAAFKDNFGKDTNDPDFSGEYDMSCNGIVNFVDLALFRDAWAQAPGPSAFAP